MPVNDYIKSINAAYRKGNATEHTYRTYLQTLIEELNKDVSATNEPRRIACGAPDYIITKKGIPIGYVEAKDVGINLAEVDKSIQLSRYKTSLDNLVLTNYLDFIFYKENKKVAEVSIGKVVKDRIEPLPDNFKLFVGLLKDFCSYHGATIDSAQKLAVMMADKAKIMAELINNALVSDEDTAENSTLREQLDAFRKVLIHDIKPHEFADVYAQTIAYGMFAARLHDTTFESFSRQEAAELIPKTNPFLRKLFGYIAGPDIDDRIKWVVDALADVFSYADVGDIMRNYGKATQTTDPIIHFYETFLAEYDPKLRKSRGVYYTPEPVVQFIVRAVDDILKKEFNLPMGLADTSKITVPINKQGIEVKEELHKVQILDPATGTGTFLAEVIRKVHENFKGQKGVWSKYVEEHLMPRVHGFELLMASYAMAHLKLDLLLKDTGYVPKGSQRLRVYLTNSLEEHHPDTGTLFASWLSQEASEANFIKRDVPVMVVLGNPPYSGHSVNIGPWIMSRMSDYKQEPGGGKLKERNSKWLNDDYVKFIRYGEYYIDKNKQGILAYVNNHGFIDNPTFRGMRWHLLNTFDAIYILDLHGNAKKKEVSPDGSIDKNVFDIQQGVSINIFVKKDKKKKGELAKVYHLDLYGSRESKYQFCIEKMLYKTKWEIVECRKPSYSFMSKNDGLEGTYGTGFGLDALFLLNGVGMTTAHDDFVISESAKQLVDKFEKFKGSSRSSEDLHKVFDVRKKIGWDILKAWDTFQGYSKNMIKDIIKPVAYRPFDYRYIIYEDTVVWRTVRKVMKNFLRGENVGLLLTKAFIDKSYNHVFVVNNISEAIFLSPVTGSNAMNCPLYLYPDEGSLDKQRRPNLDMKIVAEIANKIGQNFTNEKTDKKNTFAPIDILDYIYGVLHSPTYRETYKEFLKTNFPRVPYPKDAKHFFAVGKIGKELRELHLMEHPLLNKLVTQYPVDGNNTVEKVEYKGGKVYINKTQYFDKVPEEVWNFYIGGYQVAQKWLKDRKGRALTYDDITHYQRVIVALKETIRLMKEADKLVVV